jgi:hypothetical protein
MHCCFSWHAQGIFSSVHSIRKHCSLQQIFTHPCKLTQAPLLSTIEIDSWWCISFQYDIAVQQSLLSQGSPSITGTLVLKMVYYSSGVLDVKSCTKNDIGSTDYSITVFGWGVDHSPNGTQAKHWNHLKFVEVHLFYCSINDYNFGHDLNLLNCLKCSAFCGVIQAICERGWGTEIL